MDAPTDGTQRKQQSQGSRPQQRTRKLDCPVSFTLKGRKKSGGQLTITEEPNQQHNHALGQELWHKLVPRDVPSKSMPSSKKAKT